MLGTTIEAVKAVLKGDSTITTDQRVRLLNIIRGVQDGSPDRVVRRAEVAHIFGCSLRTIDRLAADGIFQKVHFPGRYRSIGFRLSDISNALGISTIEGIKASKTSYEKMGNAGYRGRRVESA